MKILSEQILVDTLHKLAKKVSRRLWIASPYIGSYKSTKRILGKKCFDPNDVSVRLLTDINETSKLSADTLDGFFKSGYLKSLKGLHAKIYILDDQVIITSANLTKTAFSARFEMGVLIEGNDAHIAIQQYEKWWEIANSIAPADLEKLKTKIATTKPSEDGGDLPGRWKLPDADESGGNNTKPALNGFEYFVLCYEELSKHYLEVQRIEPGMAINLEIDALLDYLFHVGEMPSNKFKRERNSTPISFRNLNASDRKKEIKKYASKFKSWVNQGNSIVWRNENHKLVSKTLNRKSINSLSLTDIKSVLDTLNCMNSYAINKSRFLNPRNNELEVIKTNWLNLLHGEADLKTRMAETKNALNYFGDSSVQELIGFYDPNNYPIRNSNSSAGLRFFGYDVSI